MNFFIEQLAISVQDPVAAKKLLSDMSNHSAWIEDQVCAVGNVFTQLGENQANLSFNYGLGNEGKPLEFEVLDYLQGDNWLDVQRSYMMVPPTQSMVSHVGMHCTAAQLAEWREFFSQREIAVAQEVVTESHTNIAIKDERRYNYVIFDTRDILGMDVKFIVRLTPDGKPYE